LPEPKAVRRDKRGKQPATPKEAAHVLDTVIATAQSIRRRWDALYGHAYEPLRAGDGLGVHSSNTSDVSGTLVASAAVREMLMEATSHMDRAVSEIVGAERELGRIEQRLDLQKGPEVEDRHRLRDYDCELPERIRLHEVAIRALRPLVAAVPSEVLASGSLAEQLVYHQRLLAQVQRQARVVAHKRTKAVKTTPVLKIGERVHSAWQGN
jgi:hypothetical protein